MATTSVPVLVNKSKPVLVDVSKLTPPVDVDGIVDVCPAKVDLDLVLPSGFELDTAKEQALQGVFQDVVKRNKRLIDRQLKQALEIVLAKHQEDQANANKNAYSEAKSALDKANGYIKEVVEDFRVDLRKAAAKELSDKGKTLSAKQFMTIGRSAFKEMTIVRGAFQGEVNFDAVEDISKVLSQTKGSWIYCAIVVGTGNNALIAVDKTKEITKQEIGKMKDKLSSGKSFPGVLRVDGQTTVTLRCFKRRPTEKDVKLAIKTCAKQYPSCTPTFGDDLPQMPSRTELKDLMVSAPKQEKDAPTQGK
jgi:hypothetical protein